MIGKDTPFTFIDKDFTYLFDLANEDEKQTEAIDKLLNSYFYMRLDKSTLLPRKDSDYNAAVSVIEDIDNRLVILHPFFTSYDHESDILYHLANRLYVIQTKNEIEEHNYERIKPKLKSEEYRERLLFLVSPVFSYYLTQGYVYSDDFKYNGFHVAQYEKYYRRQYTEYIRAIDNLNYFNHWHRILRAFLYWVLDMDATYFKDMDRNARGRLFYQTFDTYRFDLTIRPHGVFSFIEPRLEDEIETIKRDGQLRQPSSTTVDSSENDKITKERTQQEEQRRKDIDLFLELNENIGVSPELLSEIKEMKKKAMVDEASLLMAYEITRFDELIQLQLQYLVTSDAIVRRCGNCNRYFIAARGNNEYCGRTLKNATGPCYIVGPRKRYKENTETSAISALYGRIYRRQQARNRRETLSDEDFETWRTEAKAKLEEAKCGEISEQEFSTWINESAK